MQWWQSSDVWGAIAAVVQGLAAPFLIYFTYRTVQLTHQLATLTSQQVASLKRAEVVGQIEPRGAVLADYVLTSLGPAPARDVRLELTLGTHSSRWDYPLLRPGVSQRFILPGNVRRFDALQREGLKLTSYLRYTDGTGEAVEHREETDYPKLIENWTAAGWLQIRTPDEELRRTLEHGFKEVRHAIVSQRTLPGRNTLNGATFRPEPEGHSRADDDVPDQAPESERA